MLIGYARVSSKTQDLSLQLDALNLAGCERIFSDKASGAKSDRPGLVEALNFLREGDTLVVWKLDRLGRTFRGLIELAATLESRNIDLKSVTDGIDTKTVGGRFFFHVLGAMAEMERGLLLERTSAGLEAARSRGRVGGRKRVMTPNKLAAAEKLLNSGVDAKDVASTIGVSLPTLYRHLPAGSRKNQLPNQN